MTHSPHDHRDSTTNHPEKRSTGSADGKKKLSGQDAFWLVIAIGVGLLGAALVFIFRWELLQPFIR